MHWWKYVEVEVGENKVNIDFLPDRKLLVNMMDELCTVACTVASLGIYRGQPFVLDGNKATSAGCCTLTEGL